VFTQTVMTLMSLHVDLIMGCDKYPPWWCSRWKHSSLACVVYGNHKQQTAYPRHIICLRKGNLKYVTKFLIFRCCLQ